MLTPSPQYLIKRHQTYYYRRRIPIVLRPLFGCLEFMISLKTTYFQDAKKLANRYDDYFNQLIHQETIKNMRIDPRKILGLTVKTDKDGNKDLNFPVEEMIALRTAGFTIEDINSLMRTAQSSTPGSTRISENLPILNQVNECSSEKQDPTPAPLLLLSQAIIDFNDNLIQSKSTPDWLPPPNQTTFFRRLIEIIGDKPINNITRADANKVRNDIKLLPANTAKYRNNTVAEILSLLLNADVKPPYLTSKSINSHLELYTRLFNWAINEGHTKNNNPFNELRITKDKKIKAKNARLAFTRQDIITIFSTKLYTEGQYNHPYQFWVPLIALFTGARRAEIAALYIADIYKFNEIYVFDFNENTNDKHLKTPNSIRKTPIHPFLVNLGLLDFVDACRNANKTRLFEGLSWTKKEGYARVIGDWFNGFYLKDLGLHIVRKKVLHSFRHTFATELDKCNVDIKFIEQLSGREIDEKKAVDQTTYIDDAEITKLLENLEKLDLNTELKNVKWISKSLI